ncbi:MAG: hypothetical protein M5U34_39095 [Chloroflexi bacterium]|nr:hypothetical protein [Chloroflexota bacterium]
MCVKHARASRVDLCLDYSQAGTISLTIADNGVGTAVIGDGFGLLGIRERVHLLGGHCQINTAPGAGFTLTAVLPLQTDEISDEALGGIA